MTGQTETLPMDNVEIDRIVVMLQEAAALVAHDAGSTRLRINRVSALLDTIQPSSSCSGQIVRILAPWQARRVQNFIDENLDCPIRIEALAGQTRLSVSYFFRAFRGTFGAPPHAYIMHCRTERAMTLLLESDAALAQIAVDCGFSDQAHFSRVFAKRTGVAPGAWRRLQRGALSVSI